MRTSNVPRQIIGIDVIRAAAALLVMCFHWGFWIWREPGAQAGIPAAYAPFTGLFSRGWVGVEVFFVISGFVIAYSTEKVTPGRFVRHRIKRLLPAAVLCSTITGAILLTAYPLRRVVGMWLRSVSFSPKGPWVDGSYWTLPIEVAFYFLVLVNLFYRKGQKLSVVMWVLGVVSSVICFTVLFRPAWIPVSILDFLMYSGFPPDACLLLIHGTFFALGVFLYQALLREVTANRVVAVLVCGAGCVAEVIWHDRATSFVTGVPRSMLPVYVWLAAVLAIVLSVRCNAAVLRAVGDRGARMARRAGLATYPLYLLHARIGQMVIGGLHRRAGYGVALLGAAVVLVALADLVAQVLEPRVRDGLRWLWTMLDSHLGRGTLPAPAPKL